MAARTYLPTLLLILKQVCGFITKHRERILEVVGTQHAAKLDAIMIACAAFTDVALPFIEQGQ
jgi:hypothetical protein